MKITLMSLIILPFWFLGCASQPKASPKTVAESTSSRQEICQNCMAQFKASLGGERFTSALLYKQCPVCRPVR